MILVEDGPVVETSLARTQKSSHPGGEGRVEFDDDLNCTKWSS